jgi:hypothetical protein
MLLEGPMTLEHQLLAGAQLGARAPSFWLVLEHWKWVLEHHHFNSTSTSLNLSSSLMSMICFEFPLRPENKTNTKTH